MACGSFIIAGVEDGSVDAIEKVGVEGEFVRNHTDFSAILKNYQISEYGTNSSLIRRRAIERFDIFVFKDKFLKLMQLS